MKRYHDLVMAKEEFERLKTDASSHPDAIQSAWEKYTLIARELS